MCDAESPRGPWTVLLHRSSSQIHFHNQSFEKYKEGFGDPEGNHWLGLNFLAEKCPADKTPFPCQLLVDVFYPSTAPEPVVDGKYGNVVSRRADGKYVAVYHEFGVEDESNDFKLYIKNFREQWGAVESTANDALMQNKGMNGGTRRASTVEGMTFHNTSQESGSGPFWTNILSLTCPTNDWSTDCPTTLPPCSLRWYPVTGIKGCFHAIEFKVNMY